MHGTNVIAKPRIASEDFMVNSMWFTLQGEGPFVGKPAIFLRMSGCQLRCHFCDTAFEYGLRMKRDELVGALREKSRVHGCDFIVITGGEPMLQALNVIIDAPELDYCKFQIETAGAYWPIGGLTDEYPSSNRLSVVCSPKTPFVAPELRNPIRYDVYWKYIVRASEPVDDKDGLPRMSTQIPGREHRLFRPINQKSRIFVQACDEGDVNLNRANVDYAKAIALQYGYRLSLQTHKLLDLD